MSKKKSNEFTMDDFEYIDDNKSSGAQAYATKDRPKAESKKTSADKASDEMAALFEFRDQEVIADRSELTPDVSKHKVEAILTEEKASNENKGTPKRVLSGVNGSKQVLSVPNGSKRAELNGSKRVLSGAAKRVLSGADFLPDGELMTLWFLNENQRNGGLKKFKRKDIGDALGYSEGGIKSSLNRLRAKGLIETIHVTKGRHGGGGIWKVLPPGLEMLTRDDAIQITEVLNGSKRVLSGAAKRVLSGASIDDDINKSSSGPIDDVPEHIRQVQLSEAHKSGVYINHRLIAETGSHLPTAKIQEMLSYFVFEYRKKGKALCENPIGYFRKALTNGDYRKPKGYKDPSPTIVPQPESDVADDATSNLMKKWEEFCKTEEGKRFKETMGTGAWPAWLKTEHAKTKQKNLERA